MKQSEKKCVREYWILHSYISAKRGYCRTRISDLAKFIGIGQELSIAIFLQGNICSGRFLIWGTNEKSLIKLQNVQICSAEMVSLLSVHMIESIRNDSTMIYMFALNFQIAKETSFDNSFAKAYKETLNRFLASIIANGQQE